MFGFPLIRRKFRSQTSDNMDSCKKQRVGRVREEKRREEERTIQRRERVRRKKMQVREKGRKSRENTVFFSNDLVGAGGVEK